uniref:Uncharacterized protein n=1 Tax=Panagrellus redivivus TaxID=6233 RepID=A0A7E4UNH3_PANRE
MPTGVAKQKTQCLRKKNIKNSHPLGFSSINGMDGWRLTTRTQKPHAKDAARQRPTTKVCVQIERFKLVLTLGGEEDTTFERRHRSSSPTAAFDALHCIRQLRTNQNRSRFQRLEGLNRVDWGCYRNRSNWGGDSRESCVTLMKYT